MGRHCGGGRGGGIAGCGRVGRVVWGAAGYVGVMAVGRDADYERRGERESEDGGENFDTLKKNKINE